MYHIFFMGVVVLTYTCGRATQTFSLLQTPSNFFSLIKVIWTIFSSVPHQSFGLVSNETKSSLILTPMIIAPSSFWDIATMSSLRELEPFPSPREEAISILFTPQLPSWDSVCGGPSINMYLVSDGTDIGLYWVCLFWVAPSDQMLDDSIDF